MHTNSTSCFHSSFIHPIAFPFPFMGGSNEPEPPLKRLKFSELSVFSNSNPTSLVPSLSPLSASHPSHSDINKDSIHIMNEQIMAEKATVLGPSGRIQRDEFVRVITQALYSLGYSKSASLLETESGIVCEVQTFSNFRTCILDGDWNTSIQLLSQMLTDERTFNHGKSLILEQKFLELLEDSEPLKALHVLRSELAPVTSTDKDRIHKLAGLVMCSSSADLLSSACWLGKGHDSRQLLLETLHKLLPPALAIPSRRLETLVEQALDVQMSNCTYHNSATQTFPLFFDHDCGREQIPIQTIQILEDHTDEVWYLQFSKDGSRLASASKDGTVIIWEVGVDGNTKMQHRLVGHTKPVASVSWSPDDNLILSCGDNIKLWNTQTGACLHTYTKHTNSITGCAWFSDGKRFLSGSLDTYMYMWHVDGHELDSWRMLKEPRIGDLILSKDDAYLLSICNEKELRILNLSDKTEKEILNDKAMSLCSSCDGKYVLINLSGCIRLWSFPEPENTSNGPQVWSKPICEYTGHRQERFVIRSCFGGSEENFIVSGSEDAQVYLWHRDSGELLQVLDGHSGTVNSVAWSPRNPMVFASASDDGTVRLWGLPRKDMMPPRLDPPSSLPDPPANGHFNGMSNGV